MDNETLRNVQLVQLEIAKEIKRVCEVLEIDYFLDGGTLLGAVRHQGFIPWDDDLDIGMMRSDYDVFVSKANDVLSEKFYLQTWSSDRNYGSAFAKVRKKGTVYAEEASGDLEDRNGIYVDVFPYDAYPNDKKRQDKQGLKISILRRAIMIKCGYKPWLMSAHSKIGRFKKKLGYDLIKLAYIGYSKDKLVSKFEQVAKLYNDEQTEKVFNEDGATDYGEWVIRRKCFNNLVLLKFEDDYFKCPEGYEEYLTTVYGDYMKLPPIEERSNRHKIVEIKL